ELGLGGDFAILEEHAAQRERRRVLRQMFARGGAPLDGAQQDFIEAFKRATFGVEEKQLGRRLDGFLDDYAETYRAAPVVAAWGEPARIWPEGSPWLAAATARGAAAVALRGALPWETFNEKQCARWELFFAALPEWQPGATLPKPVAYVLNNALAAWPDLVELVVERRKVALPPAARDALRETVAGIVGAELQRRLEMTRGLCAVLRGYETAYHATVRRAGRLTFSDLQRLLQPDAGEGAPALAQGAAGDGRIAIDFRLDARFDHWLLDEFQDTSFGQWSVLRNLIDEAVQDPTGARSFFYVGDVKQAIFAWREGDPRLFREIFHHYNAAGGGVIAEEHLTRSWRSGPAVIAMVNRVFGADEAMRRLFPPGAAQAWSGEWREHESARPALGGYAELCRVEGEAGRFAATLEILGTTQALERGLSVAVLVQSNAVATELADFLRREGGMPAVAESDLRVATDNPLTCALLALLRVAAHPGDTLAWEHVRMTPLAAALAAEGLEAREAVTLQLLDELHTDGFELTVERWLRRLEPHLAPDDAFSRERGRQLAEAARRFDESGGREVAEFGEFAARHTVRDAETAGVVRVMTVHKAKGLGFDLVILPDLEGQRLAQRRDGLAVQRAADRTVEWVLDLPPKDLAECDATLRAHIEAAEADACYEKLCLLYVAMTRAKRAMYVVVEPAKPSSTSHNFPRLLTETLGETWSAGDPAWAEKLPPPPPAAETTAALAALPAREPRAARLLALTPSGLKRGIVRGAALFAAEAGSAAEFGSAVHAVFAGVEWWDDARAAAWRAARRAEGVPAAALAEAEACLRAPELAGVWRAPAGNAEVWREQAFEIVLDGAWVTGVIDRAIVERRADGRAVRATVFDFKTDRVAGDPAELARATQRHAPQLALYRRVVARLTGLPETAVRGELIFTAVWAKSGNAVG
ncbi:MAG: UvrD-helicase domain-containing protein, partial [Opitutae bacterium]|nr:UvrD-helicase domain-containing protein [Opitutae bacterium]